MQDRRIARGSTYAAMVIPAGTNPDAMVMERRNEDRKRRQFKKPVSTFTLLLLTVSYLLNWLFEYRVQSTLKQSKFIQTETSLPQSQSQAEFMLKCKLNNTLKSSLTSQNKLTKEMQLSFTWIDHPYHFSNQRCHPKTAANTLRSTKVTGNCSTSTPKLSQCWTYFVPKL